MDTQIKKLVDLSGIENELLKPEIIKFIKIRGIKRPISKIINLLNHPCSQEQIGKINSEFKRKYKSYEDQGMLDEIGLTKSNKQELIESMAHNAASIIGEGFDVAFKDNLNVNSVTGQITVNRDAYGQPDSRFLKCAAAEVALETPKGSESDPYKGSQQGQSRSRKHKKKSKKTRKHRRSKH